MNFILKILKLPFLIIKALLAPIFWLINFFSYKVEKKDQLSSQLLYVILLSFGAFIGWAYWAEIDRVVTAQAKAYPYAKLQTVEHFEGGRVETIHVKQGDEVERGQLLITLSPLQTMGDLAIKTDQLAEYSIRQARLVAEYESKPSFVIESDLKRDHPEIVDQERALFRERKRQRVVEIESKSAEIRSVKVKLDASEIGRKTAEKEFETMQLLYRRGLEAELSLIQSEKAFSDAISVVETTRQELLKAESDLDRIIRDQQTEILNELADVRSQLAAVKQNIRIAADKVDRSELRAPVDGVVNNVLVSTLGGTVRPGETVVEIVPDGSQIVVEALVLPADIGFIRLGQEALVKITAYDFSVFGALAGEVSVMAADTTQEESGEKFYKVTVALLEQFKDSNGHELPIIPGMEAQVDVVVGKRSAMDYLLSPLVRVTQESLREK